MRRNETSKVNLAYLIAQKHQKETRAEYQVSYARELEPFSNRPLVWVIHILKLHTNGSLKL